MSRGHAILALLFLVSVVPACGEQQPAAEQPASEATEAAESSTQAETTASSTLPATTVTIVPSDGAEPVEVEAEIADDETERQRGLMGRTELAEDTGMLFVFGREQELSFWMKDTLVALSIAYIAPDGRIVDIEDMEPLDETSHPSAEPSKYALEVNQGFFDERGIGVGDTVDIPKNLR